LDGFLCEFLLSALELICRDSPQNSSALIENEMARIIALVDTFQIPSWAIHELEELRVRAHPGAS
jgi:hypothetical protein